MSEGGWVRESERVKRKEEEIEGHIEQSGYKSIGKTKQSLSLLGKQR